MKRRLKLTVQIRMAALAIAITAPAVRAQDFTVRMKGDSGDLSTYYISQKAVRKVFNSTGTDVIYRLDQGKIVYLDGTRKRYKELTLAEAQAASRMNGSGVPAEVKELLRQMGMDAAPTITKLGPGEIIAGYPTEKYLVATPAIRVEISVAPALEMPQAYYDANALFKQATLMDMSKFDAELRKIKGMILKRVMTAKLPMGGQGLNATETAISVEKSAIPASTFAIPAGYTATQAQIAAR